MKQFKGTDFYLLDDLLSESVYTYEGTNNIHTLILGEHITGIKAFE